MIYANVGINLRDGGNGISIKSPVALFVKVGGIDVRGPMVRGSTRCIGQGDGEERQPGNGYEKSGDWKFAVHDETLSVVTNGINGYHLTGLKSGLIG